ncbi:MAG: DUF488 family protein [Candidatus Tectimicrobiota bacterium]
MLYTLGYSGWLPAALLAVAQEHNAVVCDIRFTPLSRHPQWRQGQLATLLGARYQHIQALGNRNYKNGGPIALVDYEAGKEAIAALLATGQAVILLCACAEVATCHRRLAAEQLAADFGLSVTHLLHPSRQPGQERQASLWEDRR